MRRMIMVTLVLAMAAMSSTAVESTRDSNDSGAVHYYERLDIQSIPPLSQSEDVSDIDTHALAAAVVTLSFDALGGSFELELESNQRLLSSLPVLLMNFLECTGVFF